MIVIEQSNAFTVTFWLVDESDYVTGQSGKTPTVRISKAGATSAAATNAAGEVDATNMPGLYSLVVTDTETDTVGMLDITATATGCALYRMQAQVTAGLPSSLALTDADLNEIADHVLKRTFTSAVASADGDGGTSPGARSLMGVVAKQTNKTAMSGATLTIYEDDDTTAFFTQTATTNASADPIVSLDTN